MLNMSKTLSIPIAHHAISTVAALLPALGGAVLRGSAVLACAALVTSFMRNTSAAARHLVWVSSILVVLAIPLLGRVTPSWNARVLSAPALNAMRDLTPAAYDLFAIRSAAVAEQTADAAKQAAEQAAPISQPGVDAQMPIAAPVPPSHSATVSISAPLPTALSAPEWFALMWLLGALVIVARFGIGTVIVWRTARRAKRVEEPGWLVLANRTARELGILRPVTLLASAEQVVPVTWGVVYPIVLLPESALEWQQDRREAVLVHELAHIGRLDALTQTLVQLAVAAFWFNPLVWIAAKRVRTERERACDDLVLSHGTRPSFYADDLLSMVRMLTRNTEPAFAALAMARRTEFEGRMLAILDPRIDRRRLGQRGAAIALAASLAIAIPLAAFRPLPRMIAPVEHVAGTALPSTRTTSGSLTSPSISTSASSALSSASSALSSASSAVSSASSAVSSASSALSSAHAPAAAANQPELLGGHVAACTTGPGHHVSINSDGAESTYIISDDRHCLIAWTSGKVTFADDDAHIQNISPGGHVSITEQINGVEHRYEAVPAGGRLEEKFYVDSRQIDNAAGEAWLRTVIPQLVRQDSRLAVARAARIRRQHGIAGVLAEVSAISGDYGKRVYLDALLDEGNIPPDSLHAITTFGARELTSDYDKAEFLSHAARLSHDAQTSATIATAARGISSDYYKHQLLKTALAGSGGSGDRDAMARQVIAASNGITSDYDRGTLLVDVLSRSRLSDPELTAIIGSADGISSDYYRGMVLDSVASRQSLASRSVYTMLLKSADGISSGYYRAALLKTIFARNDLTPDLAAATVADAATLGSDTDKANILSVIAATPTIKNAAVRDAYFATAKTITSGTDYRRAMTAVLP